MKVRELIEKLLEFDMGYEVRVKLGTGDFAENAELLEVRRVNEDRFPRIEIVTDAERTESLASIEGIVEVLQKYGYVEKP